MSGLFGGGGGNSVQQQVYAGIQVSTSLLGGCIPYLAGRQRVKSNLLWYGNFQVHTSNSGGGKGGGGSGTKQYSYSTAFISGLCIGPIQGVTQVWHDKALVTLSHENLALGEGGASFVGSISGTTLTVTKMNGGLIGVNSTISATNGGVTASTKVTANGTGSGGTGTYTVNNSQTVASTTMRASQLVWTGYPSGTSAGQQIPYDSTAYVASSAYNLGSSASMPNLSYEVEGVVPGYSNANSIYDADPSAVVADYLLDPVHGALAGFPGAPLAIGSSAAPLQGASNSYQAYVMSMNLLTSPYEDTQRQSTDFISELLQVTNSDCRLSVGTLEIIPYCDSTVSATVAGTAFSYTPNLTPVYSFTDDDYCPQKDEPPVKLTRKPQSDTYNTVNIEYNDRSNYYNQAPVNCSDLNDIALYGPRVGSQLSWHQITQATVAKTAGQLWLTRQLYERNSYQFHVRHDYALLEPMDLIALTDANLGLAGQVCQITEIEDDAEGNLTITARELPGVTRTTAQYNWAAAAGYFANYASDPGAVQAPAIFVMPPIPGALSEGITLGIAVCGQTANAFWLGCDVYCSVDGGSTFQYVGMIPEACRYGTLTVGLSSVADPDTTSTLSVALANTNLQLSTSVTHAEADSLQTILLVSQGGPFGTATPAEVMSFGSSSLVSAGHYNLSYLRRGLYGSLDEAALSGATWVRLDGAIFQIAMDPGMAGQTIYFKFVSFNSWQQYGPQTLAGATAYSYTIPAATTIGGAVDLIPQGSTVGISANSDQVYKNNGAASTWDSAAYSRQAFTNGCYIKWQPASGHQMVGLSSNPTSGTSYTSLDYGIETDPNGNVWSWVGPSTNPIFFTNGTSSDVYEVLYDGNWVHLYRNGSQFAGYQAGQGATYYAKVCLESANTVCSNVEFGSLNATTPIALIARGNCVVISGNRVTKIGGVGAWDSDAYSSQAYLNGCFISWRAAETSGFNMSGFATNPASTVSYTKLSFGLYLDAGSIYIYESGTQIGSAYASYSIGDSFEVRYDGVTVRYFHNGALLRAVRAAGLALYPAVCENSPGTVISNVEFGPASAVNQPTGSWLNTYPWVVGAGNSQGNYSDNFDGTNHDSETILAGTAGSPFGPYGTTETIWKTVGAGAAQNGGWNNSGDLYGIDSTKTYRSCVWVYWNGTGSPQFYHGCDTTYTNDLSGAYNGNPYFSVVSLNGSISPNKWYLAVGILHGSVYGTTSSGTSGVYDPATGQIVSAGTEFKCIAAAPHQTQRVYQYYSNNSGSIVYFAKPRWDEVNGNEPSLQALMAPAAALQGFVSTGNCAVTGQTFAKQGGSSSWDSCVYSVKGYTTAHVGGKPNDNTNFGMIGFATNPSLSSSYANGSFLWYQAAGTWGIYESGTSIGSFGAVSTTDLAEITYDGSTITYFLNKTVQRTVSASGLTLYAFVPIDSPGFGWNSVNFGPTTNLAVQDTAQLGNNAATTTYTSTVSGPVNVYTSGTTGTLLTSISVPAIPFAATVVVTVTGNVDHHAPSAQFSSNAQLSTSGTAPTSWFADSQIARNADTSSPDAGGSWAIERTYSIAANTATTFYLYAWGGGVSSAGAYVNIYSTNMKCEILKK